MQTAHGRQGNSKEVGKLDQMWQAHTEILKKATLREHHEQAKSNTLWPVKTSPSTHIPLHSQRKSGVPVFQTKEQEDTQERLLETHTFAEPHYGMMIHPKRV